MVGLLFTLLSLVGPTMRPSFFRGAGSVQISEADANGLLVQQGFRCDGRLGSILRIEGLSTSCTAAIDAWPFMLSCCGDSGLV